MTGGSGLEKHVDTTDGELKTGAGGSRDLLSLGLARIFTGFTFSCGLKRNIDLMREKSMIKMQNYWGCKNKIAMPQRIMTND